MGQICHYYERQGVSGHRANILSTDNVQLTKNCKFFNLPKFFLIDRIKKSVYLMSKENFYLKNIILNLIP